MDTSHWNGLIAIPADFWIGKVTQGTTFVDPGFAAQRQWFITNSPDTVRFGYHYADYGDAVAEANFFLQTMKIQPGEGTAIDIEDPTITGPALVEWVLLLATTIKNATGKAPLWYIDISLANAYDWSSVFTICGPWLAAPSYTPQQNAPVKFMYVFQQTGTVNGVDQDVFFGTEAALRAYATPLPPPPAPPAPVPSPPAPTTPVIVNQPIKTTPAPKPVVVLPNGTLKPIPTTGFITTKDWWQLFVEWFMRSRRDK